MSRKMKYALVIIAFLAAGTALYFFVIKPMIEKKKAKDLLAANGNDKPTEAHVAAVVEAGKNSPAAAQAVAGNAAVAPAGAAAIAAQALQMNNAS